MTSSRGGLTPAFSAMPSTQCLPQSSPSLGSPTRSSWAQAEAIPLADRPARAATRFILCSCFMLMLLTFTPPWRAEGLTGGATDFVAMLKAAARAVVLAGTSLLLWRNCTSPEMKKICGFLLPWLGFAGWAVASVLWSPLKSVSLGQAASFVILLMLTIAVALTVGKVAWDRLVHGLVFQLLLLCVLLLIAYVALPDWGSLSRARTGLLHATNASATASLGFILLLSSRLLYGWRWTRSLLLPGLAIFATVLALAQSRTALAITVIVCAGLSALLAPPLWRAIGMASIGIGGVLYLAIDLGAGTTDFVLAELSTYLSRGQTVQQMAELSGREEMWTAMWNSFLTSPWIGHGYFVCASTGELYVWYSWGNWTAHNFWLQVLVTTGVIGCCWMVWAIAKFAFGLLRAVWREEFEWQFAAFVGAIMFWQIGWGINNESFAGPLQPECVVYLVLLGITAGRLAFSPLSAAEPVKQCSTPKF